MLDLQKIVDNVRARLEKSPQFDASTYKMDFDNSKLTIAAKNASLITVAKMTLEREIDRANSRVQSTDEPKVILKWNGVRRLKRNANSTLPVTCSVRFERELFRPEVTLRDGTKVKAKDYNHGAWAFTVRY